MTKSNHNPLTIHADPFPQEATYPSHTHGLNNIGLPEFMIDPFAFSPQGNVNILHAAYRYFTHPGKKEILNLILQGETVELFEYQLFQDEPGSSNRTICLRAAPTDFEGLRLAYPHNEGVDLKIGVIQLFVKGDDFALTDEYYEGGVSW